MVVDTVLTYQFIKKLTTPFNQLPAYRLHLIDEKGNFLKARNQFTNQEKNACGLFDVMIINLKKLIAKIPGGGSRLGTVAATLVLLNTKPIRESFEDINIEEDFYRYYNQIKKIEEDGAATVAPVNSVANTPELSSKNPPVAVDNAYKRKNEKDTAKMKRGIIGSVNVKESGPEGGFAGDSTFNAKPSKELENKIVGNKITLKKKVIEGSEVGVKTEYDDGGPDYVKKNSVISKKVSKSFKKFIYKNEVKESSTLEYHDVLNPKIWLDGKLKDDVRGKLLQIADAWREFAKIHPDTVVDIILTGGNANYNYTPQSDLDLHLIINRGEFNGNMIDRAFVDEYLQDKKILWTLTHGDINIYGYPVELYAQDINDLPHSGQGVYSVKLNQWIQEPEYLSLDFENDPNLQDKVDFYKDMIDKLIDQQADSDAIDTLKDRIKSMRGDSIAQGGEFAFGNLVFKELRNSGYLDKLSDYDKTRKDKALSLG